MGHGVRGYRLFSILFKNFLLKFLLFPREITDAYNFILHLLFSGTFLCRSFINFTLFHSFGEANLWTNPIFLAPLSCFPKTHFATVLGNRASAWTWTKIYFRDLGSLYSPIVKYRVSFRAVCRSFSLSISPFSRKFSQSFLEKLKFTNP